MLADEHAALRAALADAGVEVVEGRTPVPGDPDAVYAFDPAIVLPHGALVLRSGKAGRVVEAGPAEADLRAAGSIGVLETAALDGAEGEREVEVMLAPPEPVGGSSR